jgi:tetratricopeptide (TPR) repeat protein
MRRALLGLLVVLAALPARAAYDDLGAGARAAGMGNAFAPVADDVFTIYYNPAGLGTLERPELGTAYSLLYPGLTDNSNLSNSFVGYAQPLGEGKQGTLGAAWNSFSLNSTLYREDAFYLSYGRLIWSSPEHGDLYGGVNLKYLRSSFGSFAEAYNAVPTGGVVGNGQTDPVLAGKQVQTAYDSDLGLLYQPSKQYSLAVSASHINQPNISFSQVDADRLPMLLKLGVDYRSLISNLVAEYDTQQSAGGGRDNTFTLGAERWFPQIFSGDVGARAAVTLGSQDYKEIDSGVSYRSRRFEVDYSLAIPVASVAGSISSHKISVSFRFGRKTEVEESLQMVLEAMKQLKAGQRRESLTVPDNVRPTQKLMMDEYLALVRGLESRGQYYAALQKFNEALQVGPADPKLLDSYGRLSFVAQQIKILPDYKTDPMQASLHVGLLAYCSGNDLEAISKISEALGFKPDWKELDAFLTQLETITGVKRAIFAAGQRPDQEAAIQLAQANASIEDGDYAKAVDLALAVLRAEPHSAAAWEDLGTAYFALNDYDSSLKAWQKAQEYEGNPAVRNAIRETIRSIRRARERAPATVARPAAPPLPAKPYLSIQEKQSLFDQAVDHYTRHEFLAAKKLLEQILETDPDNVDAQKALRRVKDELP